MQKGTKGTQYKPAEERRTVTMSFRVTEEEAQKIKEKAAASGMSLSNFLIESAMKRRVSKPKAAPAAKAGKRPSRNK